MPDILLVEDKDSLRRVLRLTLEHAGYTVAECADARISATPSARAAGGCAGGGIHPSA